MIEKVELALYDELETIDPQYLFPMDVLLMHSIRAEFRHRS